MATVAVAQQTAADQTWTIGTKSLRTVPLTMESCTSWTCSCPSGSTLVAAVTEPVDVGC